MAWLDPIRRTALLLPILLPACLDLEHHLELRADGSGSQRIRLRMGAEAMERARMFGQVSAPGGVDPLRAFERKQVELEVATSGLSLDRYAQSTDRGDRILDLTLGFRCIGQVNRSPIGAGRAQWRVVPTDHPGVSELLWFPQGEEAWRRGLEQARELAAQPEDRATQWFRSQREKFQGLDIRLSLKLPGDVVACSPLFQRDKGDPTLVVSRVRTADIRDAHTLVRLLAPRIRVRFLDPGGRFRAAANRPAPEVERVPARPDPVAEDPAREPPAGGGTDGATQR